MYVFVVESAWCGRNRIYIENHLKDLTYQWNKFDIISCCYCQSQLNYLLFISLLFSYDFYDNFVRLVVGDPNLTVLSLQKQVVVV